MQESLPCNVSCMLIVDSQLVPKHRAAQQSSSDIHTTCMGLMHAMHEVSLAGLLYGY